MKNASTNVIVKIIEYLTIKDTIRLGITNKKLQSVVEKEQVWKFLCHQSFSFFVQYPEETWRQTYHRYYSAGKGQASCADKRYTAEIIKEHLTSYITAMHAIDNIVFTCDNSGVCLATFISHANIVFNDSLEFDEDDKRKTAYEVIKYHVSQVPITSISLISSTIILKTEYNQFLIFKFDYANRKISELIKAIQPNEIPKPFLAEVIGSYVVYIGARKTDCKNVAMLHNISKDAAYTVDITHQANNPHACIYMQFLIILRKVEAGTTSIRKYAIDKNVQTQALENIAGHVSSFQYINSKIIIMANDVLHVIDANTLQYNASMSMDKLHAWEFKAIAALHSVQILALQKGNKKAEIIKFESGKFTSVAKIDYSKDVATGELTNYDLKDYSIAMAYNNNNIVVYSAINGKKIQYLRSGSSQVEYPGYIKHPSYVGGMSQIRVSDCNIIGTQGNLLLVYAFF